jgi:hypothetical protein
MKCDAKKLEFWQKRLKDFDNSTLTGTEFCKAKNLVYSQFLYWKKTIKNKSKKPDEQKKSWANVKIDNDLIIDSKSIEVVIGKATVKLDANFDQKLFEKVMKSLVKLC